MPTGKIAQMLMKRAKPAPQGGDTLRQLIASLAIGGDMDPGFVMKPFGEFVPRDQGFEIPTSGRDIDPGFSIPGSGRNIDPGFAPKAGPPAPQTYAPSPMIGRDDSAGKGPGFLEDMGPMLIAGLADILSTEGMMRFAGGQEDNPLLPKVGGSVAPAMGVGTLLQALAYHKLGKKKPGIAGLLKTQQTASSGTLAGQNFSQIRGNAGQRDDRLSVWGAGR